MWSNPGVVDLYIQQEVDRLADQEPDSTRSSLSDCAKRFFRGQLSVEDAYQTFRPFPSAVSVIAQIQQMLEMSDIPLPGFADLPSSANAPRRKSLPWTNAEDLRLLVAVARFGAKDWRWISSFLGAGRRPSQCNQRWCRAIDPAISHRAWEDDEDQKLLRAVEVLGKASWCQIAKIVSGRTDLQCRYRYLQLVKRTPVAEKADAAPVVEPTAMPQPSVEITRKRRNSISIAPFTDLDSLKSIPAVPMLPYYLESSLTPRNDPTQQYLHRVPPLLFSREQKK
jgi:hypothetical protein